MFAKEALLEIKALEEFTEVEVSVTGATAQFEGRTG